MIFRKLHIWSSFALAALWVVSCNQQGNLLVLDENAPAQTMRNATIQHTDSGRLQMIIWGEEVWNFDDEDQTQEFPSSIKATFYDADGNISSVVTADEATNWQKKKLMHLRGNVIIVNDRDGTRTYTDNFFWDQDKEEIYTDAPFLRVFSDGRRQRGVGFRADERMNNFEAFNFHFEF